MRAFQAGYVGHFLSGCSGVVSSDKTVPLAAKEPGYASIRNLLNRIV